VSASLAVAKLNGKIRRLFEGHGLLNARLGEYREEVSVDGAGLGVCKASRGERSVWLGAGQGTRRKRTLSSLVSLVRNVDTVRSDVLYANVLGAEATSDSSAVEGGTW
jgi:hypothetical protein